MKSSIRSMLCIDIDSITHKPISIYILEEFPNKEIRNVTTQLDIELADHSRTTDLESLLLNTFGYKFRNHRAVRCNYGQVCVVCYNLISVA